ncbi:DUF2497 domain-containing protein [Altericroceibacterium xinjiangense]|uniref:DUF2497 domain-containing protein n=1 Tax=Altericroceibacterium xinjiangense TaxID=762261 RepID=UPI000F7DCA71|nr:DUF2497 domain-containing protein [Altericroceibacterium xinjiangense]
MPQDGEPSVEEILESIKKVIARDNRESARALRQPHAEEDEDVLDLGEADEFSDAESADDEAPLTAERSARAMRESLAALAVLSEPGASPQIVRSGETSLESMVREMLRPMLAQWLDAHLPPIVERLVKAEIARIAGKKG